MLPKIIIDNDMLVIVGLYKWSVSRYVYRRMFNSWTKTYHNVKLHHVIAGHPLKGFCIDHINGNPLNNRRSNLRIVTLSENARNTPFNRFLCKHRLTPEMYLYHQLLSSVNNISDITL
jgi:hypothetical protein